VRGKRILDIACGSNSSRSPDSGERTAAFEPWFCRLLLELGAEPVGVDAGDGIQDSRLFGSPEFRAKLPHKRDHERIKTELRRQERRLLRPGGVIIHSDNP
jgi:hypothetical protein